MEGKLQGTKTMGTLLRRMKVIVFFHVWDKMDFCVSACLSEMCEYKNVENTLKKMKCFVVQVCVCVCIYITACCPTFEMLT